MKKLAIFVAIFMVFGLASQASALILDFDDSAYLGHISDGIPPSGYEDYLKDLITLTKGQGDTTIGTETYDRIGSTLDGPFDTPDGGIKIDDPTGNLVPLTGYQYIMGKYDGPNDGVYVWYFQGGLPDIFTDLPTKSPINYGLSNIAGFNSVSVPEPATVMLLGFGLVGLAGMGRKKLFKK